MSSCLLWTLKSIVQILNLEHVEENLVSIPFCKCKICVFGFLYEWCYFYCETVWPFVCVSSPLRTRWGRGWFRRPPQAAPGSPHTTPPTPTPPPITRPPSREGHPVLKQPGNLSTTLVCLKAFWMKSLMLICCRSHALHHQGEFLQFIIQYIAQMGAFSAMCASQFSRDLMLNAMKFRRILFEHCSWKFRGWLDALPLLLLLQISYVGNSVRCEMSKGSERPTPSVLWMTTKSQKKSMLSYNWGQCCCKVHFSSKPDKLLQ